LISREGFNANGLAFKRQKLYFVCFTTTMYMHNNPDIPNLET